jgi:DNA-binding NtrC family response regulator
VRILVVTPDLQLAQELAEELSTPVDVCADFRSARQKLTTGDYGLMFTELRLGAYNGLQLAYLAKQLQLPTRVVVFTSPFDKFLATEAVAAGAFYEHAHKVVAAARGYLGASLPDQDRRDPSSFQTQYPDTGMRSADRH